MKVKINVKILNRTIG